MAQSHPADASLLQLTGVKYQEPLGDERRQSPQAVRRQADGPATWAGVAFRESKGATW